MSAATAPGDGDIHGDQRGRIIGTMVALLIITPGTVALRFLSRKLSRAGFWVGVCLYKSVNHRTTH